MEIEFLKMQGCADDTVVVDCFKRRAPEEIHMKRLAQRVLDRTCGVGANTLLVLAPGNRSRISVRGFNAAGEESTPSCNAIRCAARYASDSGLASTERFPIETSSGSVTVEIIDSMNVRVDMGIPVDHERDAEIREKPLESFTRTIVVDGKSVTYTPVSLGVSYAIVFMPAFDFPFLRTGRGISLHPDFPEATDIGFTQVFSREEIRLRVWEAAGISRIHGGAIRARRPRMGYERKASCSGAAAAVVASVVNGFCDREVFVHLSGGDVFLQWEEGDNKLYLTGPAVYVFTGTFYFEEEER